MTEGSARDSLPQLFARRARNASDAWLAVDAAAGLIAAAAAAVIRSSFSPMLAASGMCLIAFGLWGIADRELSERRETIGPIGGALLVSARAVAAALGVIGGLGLIFGGLAVMLGTWVS